MKSCITNKSHLCSYQRCPVYDKVIDKGSPAFIKKIRVGGAWRFLYYHEECAGQDYLDWLRKESQRTRIRMMNKAQKVKQIRPRGRPVLYKDPDRVRKIRARIFYYRRIGKLDKAELLEAELGNLAIQQPKPSNTPTTSIPDIPVTSVQTGLDVLEKSG